MRRNYRFNKRYQRLLILALLLPLIFEGLLQGVSWFAQPWAQGQLETFGAAQLRVRPQIRYVGISWLRHFPRVGVRLHHIDLPSLNPEICPSVVHLAALDIRLQMRPLLRGKIRLHSLTLYNGEIALVHDAQDQKLFDIQKPRDKTDTPAKSLPETLTSLGRLPRIRLVGVSFRSQNIAKKSDIHLQFKDVLLNQARLQTGKLGGRLRGDLTIERLSFSRRVPENDFLLHKYASIDLQAGFDIVQNQLLIESSRFELDHTPIEAKMKINFREANSYHLSVRLPQVGLLQAFGFLPPRLQSIVANYESEGTLDAHLNLYGRFVPNNQPQVRVDFSCYDLLLINRPLQDTLSQLKLRGSFANTIKGVLPSPKTTQLRFESIEALNNGKPLDIKLKINDLSDPEIDIRCQGRLNLAHVFEIIGNSGIEKMRGAADVMVVFKGRLNDLRDNPDAPMLIKGYVRPDSLDVKFRNLGIALSGVSGLFQFDSSYVKVQQMRVSIGQSDLTLSGNFVNLAPFLLGDNALQLKAAFKSHYIDVSEIIQLNKAGHRNPLKYQSHLRKLNPVALKQSKMYSLATSSRIDLDLEGTIDSLSFRKIKGRDIHAAIHIADSSIQLERLSMHALEGLISLDASIEVQNQDSLAVTLNADIDRVNINQFFVAMENFGQHFFTDQNIRGRFSADITMQGKFDTYLNLDSRHTQAIADIRIVNGVLVKFPPLIKLSRYIFRNRDLETVYFPTLNNVFEVKQDKLIIPEMIIGTSVIYFAIGGTYQLDESLDMMIKVPLNNFTEQYSLNKVSAAAQQSVTLCILVKGPLNRLKSDMWLASFTDTPDARKRRLAARQAQKMKSKR
ncbi:AsmA-like C-terminal region-containing protein [Eisenibacter elegans]|uniref:AsmA-like C-terminal region-containing protein n=1 Tax=Eisenibacter elegans TaxID=997 RepID=UPI0009D666B6|nr:AsmA-like C-terminal region-containing protein [Eisenibacter elegans]